MFRNYFKTAFRFLLKNGTFSFINITGLAVGTLCCLYIVLYVLDQYSYDRHHRQVADIYRVTTRTVLGGNKHNLSTTSPPIAPAMKQDFAEVQQFTRVIPTLGVDQHLLHYKDQAVYETDARLVDSTFFDVFTYRFVYGHPATALAAPYSVVLLRSTAEKLFGSEDPVGEVIQIDNAWGKENLKVTGVVDESLGKSHIRAHLFINLSGYGEGFRNDNSWAGNNFASSYVKLHPNTYAASLERKLPAFLQKHGQEQLKETGMQKQLFLQPVIGIHTTPGYEVEPSKTVSHTFLYILLLIAGLIQLIACINFMNLSTARTARRAREVGVRKVMGAGKGKLVVQFLCESFLLTLLGVLIALPLLLLALPYLNQVTETDIRYTFLFDYRIWLALGAIVLVTGLAAGSYPAFYLSAFDAVKVIKGNFTSHISAAGIRRSLVVFQFVLSIVLIMSIIVIYSQLNYIRNKDLGFGKDQQLVFTFHTGDSQSQIPAFMNSLQQLPEVKAVSRANNYPGKVLFHNWGVYLPGGNVAGAVQQENIATDEHFITAMNIQMASGRNFRLHDSGRVLINETLAKRLGLQPATAPGTRLHSQVGADFEVVGVMKDFNHQSLHEAITPFMLIYHPNRGDQRYVIASTSSRDYKTLFSKIGGVWRRHLPQVPFEYTFLNDEVQKLYESEVTLSNIIRLFTLMAIFISCLGLFGLTAFSAEQRSKEISIRKVLGASVTGIVRLLSGDFLKLVAIALLIAAPLAWWAMSRWLEAFVYRVDISWWMFALAGLLAIVIALATVSVQAVKAAVVNPVKNLNRD